MEQTTDILEAIKTGNNQLVLSMLYKTVLPNVMKLIVRNNGDEEEAKDIFQDAVLIFYNQVKQGKFNEEYEIGGYIYAISRNLWINRTKRINRTSKMAEDYENVAEEYNFLEDLISREQSSAIESLMNLVGEECKKLLKYSTYEKLSMKEICAKMGFSSENVAKTYNYRCKQKLIGLVKNNQNIQELFRS